MNYLNVLLLGFLLSSISGPLQASIPGVPAAKSSVCLPVEAARDRFRQLAQRLRMGSDELTSVYLVDDPYSEATASYLACLLGTDRMRINKALFDVLLTGEAVDDGIKSFTLLMGTYPADGTPKNPGSLHSDDTTLRCLTAVVRELDGAVAYDERGRPVSNDYFRNQQVFQAIVAAYGVQDKVNPFCTILYQILCKVAGDRRAAAAATDAACTGGAGGGE